MSLHNGEDSWESLLSEFQWIKIVFMQLIWMFD
jgi:hypothetical protein